MTCGEFLARHSEYLDEELGAETAAEMRLHIAGCQRCTRYDRVLRRGLALVRDMEPVLPATDSFLALHRQLARTTPPPGSGMYSPVISFKRVDLPAPLGPMRPTF